MKKVTALAEYEEVKNCVRDYFLENYRVPTVRRVEQLTGISKSAAARYMKEMENNGLLVRQCERQYMWAGEISQMRGRHVPVIGEISCGFREEAIEDLREYIVLPEEQFRHSGNYFVLIADGTSMIGAGIDRGDYVLIHQQETVDPGQIAVAVDEYGLATLKRVYPYPEEGVVELVAENPDMPSQFIYLNRGETLTIQGVAEKVIKIRDLY